MGVIILFINTNEFFYILCLDGNPSHKTERIRKMRFMANMDNETCMTLKDCASDCTIDPMPNDAKLAFAYVKFQQYGNISDREEALARGTVFGELYMPYNCAKRRSNDGCCK